MHDERFKLPGAFSPLIFIIIFADDDDLTYLNRKSTFVCGCVIHRERNRLGSVLTNHNLQRIKKIYKEDCLISIFKALRLLSFTDNENDRETNVQKYR